MFFPHQQYISIVKRKINLWEFSQRQPPSKGGFCKNTKLFCADGKGSFLTWLIVVFESALSPGELGRSDFLFKVGPDVGRNELRGSGGLDINKLLHLGEVILLVLFFLRRNGYFHLERLWLHISYLEKEINTWMIKLHLPDSIYKWVNLNKASRKIAKK